MNQLRSTAAVVCLFLGACGGGGGGGGVVTPPPPGSGSAIEVPFTSFAAIRANETTVMNGVAATASGTATADGSTITSANLHGISGGEARLTYDAGGALKVLDIRTAQTSVLFNRDTAGHSLACSGGVCGAANSRAEAVAIDPFVAGWNYQSFGVWTDSTGPTTWAGGAISVGAPTSVLPTTGVFLFTGLSSGLYADSSGTPFFTAARMSANVDFGARSIGFTTSDTTLGNLNTGATSTNVGLNLTGNLSYAPSANSFSGNLSTANGQLAGQGSGRFYGPAAEEIGGVYSLQGVGGTMVGGFGGKR